ncbi:sprouty-related, EVH1 domain-containing protein 1 isoform X2 [Chrysoperla carnea]|uniref:sprouty-related, EVH1 domain-containing protein 1 isoform X2 n=1 Tax=Chrysoperla carnea TaxID=189513 RepID=UPI001D084A6A|nr:sprouty-related, EVH1 domain-containing protein 1 isoform X2 [Chrysoperla carnea]
MTEAYEDGNYLVRVRAQVMTRDDSSGGWVPLGGGGLSNVSVRKRVTSASTAAPKNNNSGSERSSTTAAVFHRNGGAPTKPGSRHSSTEENDNISIGMGHPAVTKHEYFIFGKRISDQSIVLSCTIKKDFEYNKVMPTFHHWRTEDKKFGLTFQTAADARAFDKGVRTAVEDLLDEKDLGDDDVFMTLNLPIEPPVTDTRSSSEGSGSISRLASTQPIVTLSRDVSTMAPHHLHRIHYTHSREMSPPSSKDLKGETYSYVQLAAPHEYIYPVVEESKSSTSVRSQDTSLKKRTVEIFPPQVSSLSSKSKYKKQSSKNVRSRCRYCNEYFSEDDNPKGSCEYAPDSIKSGIDRISCMNCAQCMVYHCMSDAEGDFATQPCACSALDRGCVTRWIGVTLLSFFVPCLWFYPPLRVCHKCGVCCGLCGGQHSPLQHE